MYFPESESKNGWKFLKNKKNINLEKLDTEINRQQVFFGNHPNSIVIIKDGYLAFEYNSFMTLPQSRFDIWSCTKSFTSLAWLLFLDEVKKKANQKKPIIDLSTQVHTFLPKSFIKTDIRKKRITLHHLLSMTSGVPGEAQGIYGLVTKSNDGPFEFALGFCDNRYGKSVSKLSHNPGENWDYSDAGVAILSHLFFNIAKMNIHEYLDKKIFKQIGIENASWDLHGGGKFLGPYTSSHIGLHISARDLSRFGFLLLNKGKWKDKQLVPSNIIKKLTTKSQNFNVNYGYQYWLNTDGRHWNNLPKQMFALEGYNSNRCYIFPTEKLIVTRIGAGPSEWNEQNFISNIYKIFKK